MITPSTFTSTVTDWPAGEVAGAVAFTAGASPLTRVSPSGGRILIPLTRALTVATLPRIVVLGRGLSMVIVTPPALPVVEVLLLPLQPAATRASAKSNASAFAIFLTRIGEVCSAPTRP